MIVDLSRHSWHTLDKVLLEHGFHQVEIVPGDARRPVGGGAGTGVFRTFSVCSGGTHTNSNTVVCMCCFVTGRTAVSAAQSTENQKPLKKVLSR